MRVIAGTFRSRQLVAPRGIGTRPTSDRLRETLFNILAPRVANSRFVDLYAGTGAVGIEALSRGAAHVWFAEKSVPAVAAMRSNLSALNITGDFTLETRGVATLLAKLSSPVDLVFLDPPYEAEAEYVATLSFFGSAQGRQLLSPNALVIAEHSSRKHLEERYGTLVQTRLVRQGDAALSFFEQESKP